MRVYPASNPTVAYYYINFDDGTNDYTGYTLPEMPNFALGAQETDFQANNVEVKWVDGENNGLAMLVRQNLIDRTANSWFAFSGGNLDAPSVFADRSSAKDIQVITTFDSLSNDFSNLILNDMPLVQPMTTYSLSFCAQMDFGNTTQGITEWVAQVGIM